VESVLKLQTLLTLTNQQAFFKANNQNKKRKMPLL
jgi:hypothetical protein